MLPNTATTDTSMENEISNWGKFWAGLLLIVLTFTAIYFVIGYWPNKMPALKDGDDGAWYTNTRFNITLIEKTDCGICSPADSLRRDSSLIEKNLATLKKDTVNKKLDSIQLAKLNDSLKGLKESIKIQKRIDACCINEERIHLNTILLLLVALMGFLGNMVHLATSFTTFVGNGTFRKNWILWYCVKPFTAAALAIIIYFIIRAGFLSYGTGASGVSLYGILSLSALAGLFTDSATLKLKEVFEVIFKPKDDRKGKLEGDENIFAITAISKDTIPTTGESTLVLSGKNLNKTDIKITIDGKVMPATVLAEKIEIKYIPTPDAIAAQKALLLITDKSAKTLYTKDIIIK